MGLVKKFIAAWKVRRVLYGLSRDIQLNEKRVDNKKRKKEKNQKGEKEKKVK